MSIVEWNDELVLGIKLIDSHHRHLVELLNKAHDSFMFGMKAGELDIIFNELVDYAGYHFSTEEGLMNMYGYSETQSHIAAHEAFKKKIVEMIKQQKADNMNSYLELTDFLLEWLINHIQNIDRLFCEQLKARGIQPELPAIEGGI